MKKTLKYLEGVGIIIIKDNKVLLVKHGDAASQLTGIYGFPAGRIEKDEEEKKAAVRELFEETGLRTEEEDLVVYPQNRYTANLKRKNGIVPSRYRVFYCKRYHGTLRATSETEPEWVAIKDIDQLNLLPNVSNAIEDWLTFSSKHP